MDRFGCGSGVYKVLAPGDDVRLVDSDELAGVGDFVKADEIPDRIKICLPGAGRDEVSEPHGFLRDRGEGPGRGSGNE